MNDHQVLLTAGIEPTICFKYDDIYFPYIVLWYNQVKNTTHYQVFYNLDMAQQFYVILDNSNKLAALYTWDTSKLKYIYQER